MNLGFGRTEVVKSDFGLMVFFCELDGFLLILIGVGLLFLGWASGDL